MRGGSPAARLLRRRRRDGRAAATAGRVLRSPAVSRLVLDRGILALDGRPLRMGAGPLAGSACRISLGAAPLGARPERLALRGGTLGTPRSEERRVGKECRS